ncbi:CPBP family intramembrane metalloprotease [Streptococcus sanguinis]|uniref:CPBP family intramembrane metalloprotease n=1 Tax=Streptococcus sanguinis TaxID=1305 RepID=A0A7H8V991_STRSA|nr:CPBP family intramembrane metalloprotease [Streptococcus sanguinis]
MVQNDIKAYTGSSFSWRIVILFVLLGTILSQFLSFIAIKSGILFTSFLETYHIDQVNAFLSIYCISSFLSGILVLLYCRSKKISLKEIGLQGKITFQMCLSSLFFVVVGVLLYSFFEDVLHMQMYWSANQSYSVIPSSVTDIILLVFCTGILVPIGEDIVFRGLLLSKLNSRYSEISSLFIASFIFAIVHLPFYGPGLTLYMFFWTCISCTLFFKYQSLYPCMLFHILNNILAYIILPLLF